MTSTESFAVPASLIDSFPSFCNRFFWKYQYQKTVKDGTLEDHEVFVHSNGICVVGIGPSHPLQGKDIVKIDFDIGNVNRSQNNVTGKSKKGGLVCQDSTTLCRVHCADGSDYGIASCIQGKLIEINKRLHDDPNLLKKEGDGYVAVILPKSSSLYEFKKSHKLLRDRECVDMLEEL